jgi:prepilin-type N-terminal cleavage/methylation domain-containing protein
MNGFGLKIDGGSDSWLKKMLKRHLGIQNSKGFTLLEMMSVLVIMGVMFSITIKKFDILSDNASLTALKVGVRELNMRETLVWTNMKLSDLGWTGDADVFSAVDKNIGHKYSWNPHPSVSGGKLHYKAKAIDLNRVASTNKTTGAWN